MRDGAPLDLDIAQFPYCPFIKDDCNTSTENPHHLSSPCRALRDSTDRMDLVEEASDAPSQSQSQTY